VKRLLQSIPWPWRVASFLFFAAGLNYADRAALSSVIPPLREELGATDVHIGIMGLLFLWSYAIASPFAGNLADRYSRSRIVVWSLTVWSLITLATGFATNVTSLFLLRCALGIAESFYLPAAGALLGDHHGPATRGRATGFHILGLNLGVFFGGAFAGLLAEHYGWRLSFWILGGAGVGLAMLSRYFIVDAPKAVRVVETVKARDAYAYLLRVTSFHLLLVSAMVAGVASWIFFTWLPLYFKENYGMNLGAAGLAGVALFKGPAVAGIVIGGWLSDKMARRGARNRVMIKALSYLASGPFLFVFLLAPEFGVVALILALSSVIRSAGVPSEHPIICDVVPPEFRSTAIGLLNTCGTAAGGVGVLLTGLLKEDLGLNVIFGASSFLFIIAGAGLLVAYHVTMPRDLARAKGYETEGGLN